MFFFSLQVKVSFDLDNIQIKYIDEDNDEVKYLLPHPTNKSETGGRNYFLPRDDLSFRRVCYADWEIQHTHFKIFLEATAFLFPTLLNTPWFSVL